MGSTFFTSELPIHKVNLSSFYLSPYEITVAEFRSFVKDTELVTQAEKRDGSSVLIDATWSIQKDACWNNPYYEISENQPVTCISWMDAVNYCNYLSDKEGLKLCYYVKNGIVFCKFEANGYRLPTEAEWEYAARGGNLSQNFAYAGSDSIDEVAWYGSNSGHLVHPVGLKKPNELGLYDMSGNVWEWCWDWDSFYTETPQIDPTGPSRGENKTQRGGSRDDNPTWIRTANRLFEGIRSSKNNTGFRIARSYKPEL